MDNIGARRLHTVLERIVEDISFDAPEKVKMQSSTLSSTDTGLMSNEATSVLTSLVQTVA